VIGDDDDYDVGALGGIIVDTAVLLLLSGVDGETSAAVKDSDETYAFVATMAAMKNAFESVRAERSIRPRNMSDFVNTTRCVAFSMHVPPGVGSRRRTVSQKKLSLYGTSFPIFVISHSRTEPFGSTAMF
jgi:hypothetical protein